MNKKKFLSLLLALAMVLALAACSGGSDTPAAPEAASPAPAADETPNTPPAEDETTRSRIRLPPKTPGIPAMRMAQAIPLPTPWTPWWKPPRLKAN